jgi:hypothetical protein
MEINQGYTTMQVNQPWKNSQSVTQNIILKESDP